ncbi:hypothetical protein HMPREF0496_2694 [Lentilactobacillus hilgardii ATCC 27305]|nr:hypothetical protein HMPREF0496_2694 [Lentilactobacillus hilgardii ATCC 27305]
MNQEDMIIISHQRENGSRLKGCLFRKWLLPLFDNRIADNAIPDGPVSNHLRAFW